MSISNLKKLKCNYCTKKEKDICRGFHCARASLSLETQKELQTRNKPLKSMSEEV